MSTNPRLLKLPICIEHSINCLDFYLIKMHVEKLVAMQTVDQNELKSFSVKKQKQTKNYIL